VLGGIGLVGVAAHDVACRRAELALRIALGADPKRIFGSTLGHSLVLVGLGLAVGVLASIWTTTVLRGFVVAANRFDVPSVVGSAALLLIAGVCAVLPAARRAARTDPLAALRE
jgi:putative ABC transport system permease protein